MEIRSVRQGGGPKSTEGDVFVDDAFECYCLELALAGDPCAIPEGRYRVRTMLSPHFGRDTIHFLDVPGRSFIECHAGNTDVDTHGCVIVGDDQTKLNDDWIGRSRVAEDRLCAKVKAAEKRGEAVWWTVSRDPAFKVAA